MREEKALELGRRLQSIKGWVPQRGMACWKGENDAWLPGYILVSIDETGTVEMFSPHGEHRFADRHDFRVDPRDPRVVGHALAAVRKARGRPGLYPSCEVWPDGVIWAVYDVSASSRWFPRLEADTEIEAIILAGEIAQ